MKCMARAASPWVGTGENTQLVWWVINYVTLCCVSGEVHMESLLQSFIMCSFSFISAREWDESRWGLRSCGSQWKCERKHSWDEGCSRVDVSSPRGARVPPWERLLIWGPWWAGVTMQAQCMYMILGRKFLTVHQVCLSGGKQLRVRELDSFSNVASGLVW